ncbi:MAG TPA: lamin tail domain-containing protein, partial [Chthoniobacteraceae bacterium]|nr:lamin tail domain-containing protein [Chthoniobacteraceae bacterium]
GEWAAGADGSGATLVRRAPDANEGPAAWTTSTTVGGTPGTQNFHEGASAVRTVNVAIGDSWKFEDSGAAAPAGWQNAGFDDGAWKSGPTLITGGGGKLARGVKPDALPNGLLAYWSFNETSGTTAVNSVNGQPNGTMANGATFVTDVIRGQVASFDGADDRMEVIDSGTGLPSVTFLPGFTATNDFTWAAWVLSTVATTDAGQSGSVILGNRTDPNGQDYTPREFIKIMPTAMQYHRQAATENLNYPDLIISAWTHICVVKRGQFLDYYRNGVFVQTLSISGGLSNPMPFFVGGDRMASVNEHFAGRVDDVALWTRALSATEIGQIGSEFGVTPPLPNPPEQTTAAVAGAQPRYFRKAFTFSGTPATATMELWPVADDGAVIYLNGAEVHRINVPPTTEVGDARFPSAPITIPSGALVAGPNVLSAEVHQFPGGNDDLLFGAQLAITAVPGPAPAAPPSLVFTEISGANDASFFIELRNTSSAAVDTAGWTLKTSSGQSVILPAQNVTAGGYFTIKAGALGFTPADGSKLFLLAPGANELRDSREVTNRLRGLLSNGAWGHPDSATPGAPNLATIASAVVINEIFYHAPGSSAEQWIELHNRTDADVSIAGWKFTDGVSYIFPVGTIVPANGFRVLAWDPAAFAALHSGVTALGPFGGSLSRKGESLTLRDANDNIVSQLTYSENGRWSQWADGGGSSLELRDRDADNRVAEAWDASDESLKTGWQTVSYGPLLGSHATTSSLAYWNEFILGLLDAGEVLVDDVSVTESGTQLIQNGTFDTGTATWRNVGNHQLTTVVDDPFAPGNKVMKIVATGATEHMSNHSETTLKAGGAFVALSNAKSYTISF